MAPTTRTKMAVFEPYLRRLAPRARVRSGRRPAKPMRTRVRPAGTSHSGLMLGGRAASAFSKKRTKRTTRPRAEKRSVSFIGLLPPATALDRLLGQEQSE